MMIVELEGMVICIMIQILGLWDPKILRSLTILDLTRISTKVKFVWDPNLGLRIL